MDHQTCLTQTAAPVVVATINDSSKIQEGPITVMKQQRLQLICFVAATSPAALT